MTGRDLRARSSVMTATEKQQAGSNHLSNHSLNVQRGRLRKRLPCVVVSLEPPYSQVRKSADDPFAICAKTFQVILSIQMLCPPGAQPQPAKALLADHSVSAK